LGGEEMITNHLAYIDDIIKLLNDAKVSYENDDFDGEIEILNKVKQRASNAIKLARSDMRKGKLGYRDHVSELFKFSVGDRVEFIEEMTDHRGKKIYAEIGTWGTVIGHVYRKKSGWYRNSVLVDGKKRPIHAKDSDIKKIEWGKLNRV
jgi:hypothetical protein